MEEQNHYFTFGAEMGDPYAADAVSPNLIQLRKLLIQHCNKVYCKEIDEIAPMLRVDGSIQNLISKDLKGCGKVKNLDILLLMSVCLKQGGKVKQILKLENI